MSETTTASGHVTSDEVLTYSQIKERYPDCWVFIEDPVRHEGERYFGGKVRYFGDHDDTHAAARDSGLQETGVLFTGRVTGDFVL